MNAYASILAFFLFCLAVAVALLALGFICSPSHPVKAKLRPFECGFPPLEGAKIAFDIRFYLVAIVFLIFDLETTLVFPWALVFRKISWFGVCSMLWFLLVLTIGFLYEWKKGALDWE